MERIKNLGRYQKGILLLLAAMLVVFTILYAVVSSRVGFEYKGSILCPEIQGGSIIYSGTVQGEPAAFTVTADHTVTFAWGDKVYGLYTAKEDPTAIPEQDLIGEYMTGVEIRDGEEVFFRGGVFSSGEYLRLINEDGSPEGLVITYTANSGTTMVDENGNVIDTIEPSASTILHLMKGPALTSKGNWACWFLGLFLSILTVVSILFVDELFRWNLAFRIRNADRVEPSDWELAGRYIGWTILPAFILAVFIMGLS